MVVHHAMVLMNKERGTLVGLIRVYLEKKLLREGQYLKPVSQCLFCKKCLHFNDKQ